MPDVVVGALLGVAGLYRQRLLVRSRAWIWDFSSTHSTSARHRGAGLVRDEAVEEGRVPPSVPRLRHAGDRPSLVLG